MWDLEFGFQTLGASSREEIPRRIPFLGPCFVFELQGRKHQKNEIDKKRKQSLIFIYPPDAFFVVQTQFGNYLNKLGGFQTFPAGYIHSFARGIRIRGPQCSNPGGKQQKFRFQNFNFLF